MGNYCGELQAEHFLYGTKEWAEYTQLENMTWLSRKIIKTLDRFSRPHQDSPKATPIMEYIKDETWITDESIIINSVKNILKYKNNDVVIWKAWKEKKNLVNLEIYNYCTTLLKWYANLCENVEDNQENIWEVLSSEQDPNQMEIEFPKDPE